MITSRKFNFDTDFKEYKSWFEHYGKKRVCPAEHALPFDGGIIVSKGNIKMAAGFLYNSLDSSMCWLEWVIVNPDKNMRQFRTQCINLVLTKLIEYSILLGNECIFTSANVKGLISKYEEVGFVKTDINMTNLIRINGTINSDSNSSSSGNSGCGSSCSK